ncbi:MAG: hypothetical protein K0S32_3918 [Bacteroidetes bacterium]|nr:hypothetical protein [Bacteroidota bacterium]
MKKPELKEEVLLSHSKVQLFEPEIIRSEILSNATIGRKESEEIVDTIGRLVMHKRVLQIVVLPNEATIYPDAREFSASAEGTRYSLAEAIIATNLAQKILVNFYLQFNKPLVISKAFNNDHKAMEWLFSLKKEELERRLMVKDEG